MQDSETKQKDLYNLEIVLLKLVQAIMSYVLIYFCSLFWLEFIRVDLSSKFRLFYFN